MSFLAQAVAYLLFLVSKWLFSEGKETFDEYVKRKEAEKHQKETLKKLKDAVQKGDQDGILEAERDLLNGPKP